ncbi:MAG: hypothetical protein JJ850_10340 [Kordiimonadaceae bacterium]|nr:hypothetical protein [Kordiimonadaceae bacterium]MBO6569533.1 hypothetical protein [Kordiimonadaceae bacterium]MBO6965008.1 hypothetical protein [Kordiimonadaceae bacterium]
MAAEETGEKTRPGGARSASDVVVPSDLASQSDAATQIDLALQKKAFLNALSAGHSVRAAAEAAGAAFDEPHNWRESDRAFADRWQRAEDAGTDVIEDEAYRRAVTGVEKPIYRGGEVVGHVADYSDSMLMFLLKSRRPDRYGGKAGDGALDAAALAERLNLKGARDGLKRKFIGWICGLALAWHFMGHDIVNWLRLAFFPETPAPPALNGTETLVTVLFSMLGLGGLRTVEKLKGVSREEWKR